MPLEIRVPQLGESISEAVISRWLKNEGDTVAAGEILVELETDKVNVELPAERSGTLQSIARKEGETVNVNDVIGLVAEGAVAAAPAPEVAAPEAVASEQGNGRAKPAATPMAERLAAEKAIDLAGVKGSGAGGRIVKEDVEAAAVKPVAAPAPTPSVPVPTAPVAPRPAPTPAVFAPEPDAREERVRMTQRRKTIARRLLEAQQSAAILTTFNEVDMSAIMALRKKRKEEFEKRHGVGLGFMSFFTKAVVGALKAYPILNAEIDGDDIIFKYHYDIGIAVGSDQGLVVPVLRDADQKNFPQIEKGIGDLAKRAREGKLEISDLRGGTFTISNGGVYGSLMSTPILNSPQVGILGMHKIQERPIVVNGEIAIRPMMYIALSYNHQIVDGSDSVRFLVRVKELIEDPEALLLEG